MVKVFVSEAVYRVARSLQPLSRDDLIECAAMVLRTHRCNSLLR